MKEARSNTCSIACAVIEFVATGLGLERSRACAGFYCNIDQRPFDGPLIDRFGGGWLASALW